MTSREQLKILHVFRAPVGGLFRHVIDLVHGQSARGHQVGIVADSLTGGDNADRVPAELAPHLALGASRVPMGRGLGLGDIAATRAVAAAIARLRRMSCMVMAPRARPMRGWRSFRATPIRVYTPHGGSLHYRPGTPQGAFYLTLEKILKARTDLFLFESDYIRELFNRRIGAPRAMVKVVHNGVADSEFAAVAPAPSATDLLYIGELRALKGVDVLIDAIAGLRATGPDIDRDDRRRRPRSRRLDGARRGARHFRASCAFDMPMPAREAFALGKVMVVPSYGESLPYIVLEAGAAAKPLIATNVGGIPEIFGPLAGRLIPPGDCAALMKALADAVNNPETMRASTLAVQARIRDVFSIQAMVDERTVRLCRGAGAQRAKAHKSNIPLSFC